MSMRVCGQTLVLVDNDATVSEVNQKLVRQTLKYMFYHRPEDRTFCFNTYEHDITADEVYSDEVNDLVCSVDTMEFDAKDSSLTDTLAEVITRWKEADFACRDILVFTDGLEGAPVNHEKEEINYLLENSGYPVYIVMLEQENNADARKGLLSVSVPSGGKLFESDFSGSDAAVDKQLTEMIFSAMDEYAAANWSVYEETGDYEDAAQEAGDSTVTDEEAAEGDGTDGEPEAGAASENAQEYEGVEADDEEDEIYTEGNILYEREPEHGAFGGMAPLVISAVLIVVGLLVAVLGSFMIMKRKRSGERIVSTPEPDEDEFFDDYELKGLGTVELTGDNEGDTVLLGDIGATRLLSSRLLTLIDKKDSSRVFRIALGAPMCIGRGRCDVVITGDDALSKRHCEIYEKNGEAYVRDLSSSNGTMVNNVKIKDEHLSDGDELTIGTQTFRVNIA